MNHEIKMAAPEHQASSIIAVTRSLVAADDIYPKNQITSLYFDTPNWSLADEKAASTYHKTKVRVRFYDELGENPHCYAEIKMKEGAIRNKIRRKFDSSILFPENQQILIHDINSFITETLGHQSEPVVPAFFIRYHRHRFTNPSYQTRIAIDSNIVAIRYQAEDVSLAQRYPINEIVLEQKGNPRSLTPDLSVLTRFGLRPEAFSKYYLGYCAITGYEQ